LKNRPVQFRFYKLTIEKNKPNPNWKKLEKNRGKLKEPKEPSQTKKTKLNWKKTEPKPSQTELKPTWTGFCPKKQNRNQSVWTSFDFFKKKFLVWLFFFIKTESNRTWSPLVLMIYWCYDYNTITVPQIYKLDE
jgi:hypothetical protein